MDSKGAFNLYEQYYRNNKTYGFYLRESTWYSIGQVLFIVGVREGDELQGTLPYFNNPQVYVKLYYTNSIGEINEATKYKVIRIEDGGSYRY
ncbi:hypothetical protein Murru_2590 [Allomuricauda ruestringensis DSM 13258]|uniref:Uncharacterized protein n=1 Tax=Allomuricauda ruestringensis (strain DSM 13258 / CIP 107369 / LMG 19739 / B1) TaxID=886377 RepID=G2PQC0_ALLRU|nr:hypothetical protein [Allomuricauda ruestringensis]AEM71626.1 hypothetical protein Murru_2590 [Allomuricauda ruestringensis DSM 13258]